MKRRLCALALCSALLLSLAPARAEEVSLREAGLFSGSARFAAHGSLVIDADEDYREGLFTIEGEEQIPRAYESLLEGERGLFVAQEEDGLNTRGVLDAQGNVLVPLAYGDVLFLSDRWAVGVVLEQTLSNVCDYEDYIDGGNYNAVTYDVYDLCVGEKVGYFTRQGCEALCAHGDYLYVLDRSGEVMAYDAQLRRAQGGLAGIYDAYGTRDGDVVCLHTGEVILENHRYAAGSGDGRLIVVDADAEAGVCSADGQIEIACAYDGMYPFDAHGYARVKQGEDVGLIDAQGNVLVPCAYDDILRLSFDGDYVCAIDGYACVEDEGKLGYVGPDGEVSCPAYYTGATVIGLSMILPDTRGELYIIAADGALTRTDYVAFDPYCGGDGRLLKAQNAQGMWGIVDWHGNELTAFDQPYASSLAIAPDGSAILVEREDGMQAYVLS